MRDSNPRGLLTQPAFQVAFATVHQGSPRPQMGAIRGPDPRRTGKNEDN